MTYKNAKKIKKKTICNKLKVTIYSSDFLVIAHWAPLPITSILIYMYEYTYVCMYVSMYIKNKSSEQLSWDSMRNLQRILFLFFFNFISLNFFSFLPTSFLFTK